jgi:hypothetical protein
MQGWIEQVEAIAVTKISALRVGKLNFLRELPRLVVNKKDLRKGIAVASTTRPEFGDKEWLSNLVNYISESEAELLFSEHYKNLLLASWGDFSHEYGKIFMEAQRERLQSRRHARRKRKYNFWCGYVLGLKVAFSLSSKFLRYKFPNPTL